jgi:SAM-dependent methyltransferase
VLYRLIHEGIGIDFPSFAGELRALLARRAPGAGSILDVACGTGQHLSLLGADLERVGIDLSAQMLAIARRQCPDVAFHQADMADFDLDRTFDVVTCLFSSVGYVGTPERLDAAIAAMARHLEPGGLLLVEPWFTPEQFWDDHLVHDVAEGEGMKLSRMYVQRRRGSTCELDIHLTVGTVEGVEHFVERHVLGLFTDAEYRAAFRAAGLEVEHDPAGLMGRGLYLGTRA